MDFEVTNYVPFLRAFLKNGLNMNAHVRIRDSLKEFGSYWVHLEKAREITPRPLIPNPTRV